MPITQLFSLNPDNINPNIGIGISIPFNSPSAFKTTYSHKDQIKYNLINLLLTNKGERLFNLNFGTNLRKQLFNQLREDNYDDVIDNIKSLISSYFPEIIINKINISTIINSNTLIFILDYSIKLTQETDTISINFE